MLAPDVRFEGFTYEDWRRVLELFAPLRPCGKPRDPDRPRGLVAAVHHDGKLLKLLHSRVGRLRLDELQDDWPVTTAELARRHDASWSLSLSLGALDDVMETVAARLHPSHDFTEQCLLLVEAFREQMLLGRLDLWPARLAGVPVPTRAMIHGTIDRICPPGKSIVIGLFDGPELWTSITLQRGLEGFELILGPDELRPGLGLLSGDFRRDHRHLLRLVEEQTAPAALGLFADYQTFRALEVDPRPGAWALAVAVRDVVLYPAPAAMAVPLGLDAGRAAVNALKLVAARVDPTGVLTPALGALRDVALGDRRVEAWLGPDLLDMLRRLLSRDA